MPIAESALRKVKETADILALAKAYGLSLEKRGSDHFARCPWHDDDTPSLSLTPGKNLFHCFGCGAKGNAIQFVQKMEGLPFPVAFEKVAGGPAVHSREDTIAAGAARHHAERLEQLLDNAFAHMETLYRQSPEAKTYLLRTRGLPFLGALPEASPLHVGYCTASFGIRFDAKDKALLKELGLFRDDGRPHFEDCVTFPLRDATGNLLGIYGRKVRGDGTHYYLRGPRKGVFALHDGSFARGAGSDFVYLVESVIDALSVHQLGIPSVLALHGVNGFTPCHEEWLTAKGIRTVYLLLDGDKAGREAASRLAARLKDKGYTVHVLELPDGEDPNSFFSCSEPPRTVKDLEALPGYPKPKAARLTLSRQDEEYRFAAPRRTYTVRGLLPYGLDRLRVTLKCAAATDPTCFHIDTLDLYAARARGALVEALCRELKAPAAEVEGELRSLIALLEEERMRLRQDGEGQKAAPKMTETEAAEALAALKRPTLVQDLLAGFEGLGVIGEEKAALLGYLGTVSRLLDQPLGMLIVSRSGAGKTHLQDAIAQLVPEESLIKYTRLTGQALFYKEKDGLKHKVLCIEEEDGMKSALYSVRTLASSQRLSVATTHTDPKSGKLYTSEYTVEGPVFILIATTNPDALDAETRSRFIVLTIDESPEQTRRIMEARKAAYTLEGWRKAKVQQAALRRFHDMQRILKPLKVINPFAPQMDYSFDRLQMRREFGKYMGLISTIALFHQYQREVKKDADGSPYIEATVEDIVLANTLAQVFFPNSVDDLAPHTRRLAGEIVKLVQQQSGEVRFTRKQLREACGWTDWSIRQGLEQLLELGYVGKVSGQNGVAFLYELLCDPATEAAKGLLLTAPETLKSAAKGKKRG